MKNILLILLFFAIISCSSSKEEKLIMERVQIIDGVKTDLSMKIKTLEKVSVVTAKDSADYLQTLKSKSDIDEIFISHLSLHHLSGSEFIKFLDSKIKNYNSTPEKVLLTKYVCTYTIQNPKLNNVIQTHTENFYLSNTNQLYESWYFNDDKGYSGADLFLMLEATQ